jgi:acetyl esterase
MKPASPLLAGMVRSGLESSAQRPMWERNIAELRQEVREQSLAAAGKPEEVASVTRVSIGGVPAWLYRPAGDEQALVVWLHGGGWLLCDPECYDTVVRALANRAGCAVLSVDYRRAPEHRYPVATDDAWNATLWASDHFGQVAVAGDSSGGNLAAAVALRARDRRLSLALQLLIYPVLDSDLDAPYRQDFAKQHEEPSDPAALGLDWRNNLSYIWQEYVPDPAQRLEADASPMHAASLKGVAPALIITAERDILRAESEQYARRLAADGVPVHAHNYAQAAHGFFHLLAATPDASDGVERSAAALRHAFRQSAGGGPAAASVQRATRQPPSRIALCKTFG